MSAVKKAEIIPKKTYKIEAICEDEVVSCDAGIHCKHLDFNKSFKIDFPLERKIVEKRARRRKEVEKAREKFNEHQYALSRFMIEKISDKEGSAEAMFLLAVMLHDGLAVEVDMARSVEIMSKVATTEFYTPEEEDFIQQAQYNIGEAYYYGTGVINDDDIAEKWWLMAAQKNNPGPGAIRAQSALGKFYSREGYCDPQKSFHWHSIACQNGSLESLGAMGIMYLYGIGVEADGEAAYHYLSTAAERGNILAVGYMMAFYYERRLYQSVVELGRLICDDFDIMEASRKTECAVGGILEGVCTGCFYLARCLHRGAGIEEDMDLAIHLYNKAAQFSANTAADLQSKVMYGII